MHRIVNTTQEQSFIHRSQGVASGENSVDWPDEAQAKARCEQANADAEALGIKARYEVRDA